MSVLPSLIETVRSSRLVAENDLIASLDAAGGDADRFLAHLQQKKLLTAFQALHLKQGRWRRFVLGKYTILDRAGTGGMGAVYRAKHRLMERTVALKVLPSRLAAEPESVKRFYREAQSLAAIDHPNIVRAYDIDFVDGVHFIVLEYVDGISIHDLILERGPLACGDAASLCAQAALGLDAAFRQVGLLHRDIKPANLLVDPSRNVKVLDLGLAVINGVTISEEREHGTPDFASPEQLLDADVLDTRSDIYSMGATLYFMLTGSTPFPVGDAVQKRIWHRTRQPRAISTFRTDLPESIVTLVESMMAKDPSNRPASFHEVARGLAVHATMDFTDGKIGELVPLQGGSRAEPTMKAQLNEEAIFANDETWDQIPPRTTNPLMQSGSRNSWFTEASAFLISSVSVASRWIREHA